MLHHLTEYGKYLEITGYANVDFATAEAYLKAYRKQPQTVEVQFFDADQIATPEHLYFAVQNALAAFHDKYNISKSAAMETLLYASGQRQIKKALQRCGIQASTTCMAVVVFGGVLAEVQATLQSVTDALGVTPDKAVLELTATKAQKIRQSYKLAPTEIQTATKEGDSNRAIVDLVIEQGALLSTQV
jgi:KEOPS complex subunit Cgi121